MRNRYRNSNRAKHRYKTLERIYRLCAGGDAEMAARAGLSINALVISVLWRYLERGGREA